MESEQPPPQQPAQQPIFVPPGHQPPPGYVAYYPGTSAPVVTKKPNGNATASLIVSGGSLALLVFSFGLIAPITLISSIVGTILGHKAKTLTDQDETVGQRDEAMAGFWMGIAGIVLAVLAILFFLALIIFLISIDAGDSDWSSYDGHGSFDDESMYPGDLQ